LGLLNNANKTGTIRHIPMMKKKTYVFFMAIPVKMINAIGVEQRRTALYAVNGVTFLK
jgi:hypothetical protein